MTHALGGAHDLHWSREGELDELRDLLKRERTVYWHWKLLDLRDRQVGSLLNVDEAGSSLEFNVNAPIRGTGNLRWTGPLSEEPDWLRTRVQPMYHALLEDGSTVGWSLGVMIPGVSRRVLAGGFAELDLALWDKTLILADDGPNGPYSLAKGTNVTTTVRTILNTVAGGAISVPASSATLRSPMVWEADTSWLRIVNDLLDTIAYWAVSADPAGVLTTGPYVVPADRPEQWGFSVNEVAEEPVEVSSRSVDVINEVVLVSRSDGDTRALVAVATNTNPDDPYSTVSRGRTISVTERDIEVTSQEALNTLAQRRLRELSVRTTSYTLRHGPLPLSMNDRVRITRPSSLLDAPAVLQTTRVDCTPSALWTSTAQEVKLS